MGATVLVVDDHESMRDVISLSLLSAGYQVLTAGHGAEALRRMTQHRVDLVLLDLHMPVLDGIGVLAGMKAKPRLRGIPVLMLTGDPDGVPRGIPTLAKPCERDQLLAAVASRLRGVAHEKPSNGERRGTGTRSAGRRLRARGGGGR